MTLISKVKREIVETLRKVVDMLGKYSSSYLPVDAKHAVRSFILSLPSRLVIEFINIRPLLDSRRLRLWKWIKI
jgi:hypothetical protein